MTRARKDLINLDVTPYYHVVSRCVRRTFLCGFDRESGRDFSYRKKLIVNRVKYLSKIFAIRIAAYAVMSNHYHLVLKVDHEVVESWDVNEILARCRKLFPNKAKEIDERLQINPHDQLATETAEIWRKRLCSLSWFMRCINEPIARRANLEDECKGHFWEGRFKSQALLDQGALLSAMVYVDLNPLRAGLSDNPELSDFTSIKERIDTLRNTVDEALSNPQPLDLIPFKVIGSQCENLNRIDFDLIDYLKLVDLTGRIIKKDKRGFISRQVAPILNRIGLRSAKWIDIVQKLESCFAYVIGSASRLVSFDANIKSPRGVRISRKLYLGASV